MPRKRGAVPQAPTLAQLRERWESADRLARGVYKSPEKIRLARGREVVAALRAMYSATGDPAFAAALKAIEVWGFERLDAGTLKRARISAGSNETVTFFPRMHTLVGQGFSVRHAAAQVACTWWIEGQSFDAVVDGLRTGYRKWLKVV